MAVLDRLFFSSGQANLMASVYRKICNRCDQSDLTFNWVNGANRDSFFIFVSLSIFFLICELFLRVLFEVKICWAIEKCQEVRCMKTVIDDVKIKNLFKQAILEAIEEEKEVVHDLLMEVMDDWAMIKAIEKGENSGKVNREEIFRILDGKERLV